MRACRLLSTHGPSHACVHQVGQCKNFDWKDSWDYSCNDYKRWNWCTRTGGYGPGWGSTAYTFERYQKNGLWATKACCACGGGERQEVEEAFTLIADGDLGEAGCASDSVRSDGCNPGNFGPLYFCKEKCMQCSDCTFIEHHQSGYCKFFQTCPLTRPASEYNSKAVVYMFEGWCSNGILNGKACCAASCGTCGGSGCGGRPGGGAKCCTGRINGGRACSTTTDTGCKVP
uniref:Uncharacterized protein n=1 Tax=Pyrodinium bahamense TaxID=73915 RepID=A0A7S0FVJ3_9DINO|mmetsp:Transcript_48574/g.135090  ORF Transcript_48574/g.135090 Transcript_48574/m.135090 type:complete len:230 (+) Transcript_48574:73-762(+)